MEWDRFRRYASWMRRLSFDLYIAIPEELLRMISVNSPNGILCHGLQELTWKARPHVLPFLRLFLSPHLTRFTFVFSVFASGITDEALSGIAPVVLALETFSLQRFRLEWHVPPTVDQRLKSGLPPVVSSAVSSTILRCGPCLTTLLVPMPLSDAAVQHIMQLPKLTTWKAWNGPPRVSNLPRPDTFLQLEILDLHTHESLKWLPLFEATGRGTSSGQDLHAQSHRGPGRKLISLTIWVEVSVDVAFISTIKLFHRLANLKLCMVCFSPLGCAFSLTDDDIAEVTAALPNLEVARFGDICYANSCRTTVSSLLYFSTRCKNLEFLQIHFNTANLRDDLERLSVDPRPYDPDLAPGRRVTLILSEAPISISEGDVGPVLAGFLRIFPSLDGGWEELNLRLRGVQ